MPLLIIVFGFIATNTLYYCLHVMQNSAQYAAMMVATSSVKNNANGAFSTSNTGASAVSCASATDSTKVEYYACQGLPTWASFSVTSVETCATPSISVSISTDAGTAAIADVFSIFTGQTLTATAVAVKQGSCP